MTRRPIRTPTTTTSSPPVAPPANASTMRLQRFLAQAGFGSRRKCEEYVVSGRISLDGEPVDKLGVRVDPETQKVRLDGELVRLEPKRYYLLNKPAGYLCTHLDPQGRPRAIDLVPFDGPRLFTVGRLDENSRGLLLVTNDGELANRLAHPRYRVERRYELQVAGKPTRETLQALTRGLHFTEGRFRIGGYRRRKTQGKSTILEVTLTEGRNREIRRLFSRVGHKVLKLTRIGFGPLRLGKLREGEHRRLSDRELKSLKALLEPAGKSRTPSRPKRRGGKPGPGKPKAGKPKRRRRPSSVS
ncbi:MAG: pseudouridine synthase [Planctomycetaceae bacterium]